MFHDYHPETDTCNLRQRNPSFSKFEDELNTLFNKKFQFRFSSTWELPDKVSWFSETPFKVKQLEILKSRLNFHKSQLNDFNIEEWSCHTRRRNPAGEVGWKLRCVVNPEFLTQAWTKFYECACTYNIVPSEVLVERQMVSLHLCEAPGAFITSLNHFLRAKHDGIYWKWLANTLNPYYEGNSPSNMISDDRFMFHTLDNWHFGADNTGNLMDWENSQAIITKAKSLGKVQLITADGSIDCLQKPDAQEEVTSPLHYCEIITALQALSPGGTLIFKLFTLFEHSTVCLLYLINHLFAEMNIYKPVTSRQGNSEVYAICLNYKGSTNLDPFLPVLKSAYGSEIYEKFSMFPLESIPEEFIKQIEECACYFSSIQCQVINNNLQAYFMQNNGYAKHTKKIRGIVASEFLWQYDLRPLENEKEILKGLLHEENKINMNPRYHRGSYTERQLYAQMSLREKWDNLNCFIQMDLTNPSMPINDTAKWTQFYDERLELKLVYTYGRPLKKINSSKFIFVPIFKLYQQIAAEDEFREIIVSSKAKASGAPKNDDFEEPHETVSFPEFNHLEDYNAFEKRCFKTLLETLQALNVGANLLVYNLNTLTHFNVSVIFILATKCFERVGFTSKGIAFKNLISKTALSYLEKIETEFNKLRGEDTKDVLNSLTVQTTNVGDFYDYIVLYNNTFYRNKCIEYMSLIERAL